MFSCPKQRKSMQPRFFFRCQLNQVRSWFRIVFQSCSSIKTILSKTSVFRYWLNLHISESKHFRTIATLLNVSFMFKLLKAEKETKASKQKELFGVFFYYKIINQICTSSRSHFYKAHTSTVAPITIATLFCLKKKINCF